MLWNRIALVAHDCEFFSEVKRQHARAILDTQGRWWLMIVSSFQRSNDDMRGRYSGSFGLCTSPSRRDGLAAHGLFFLHAVAGPHLVGCGRCGGRGGCGIHGGCGGHDTMGEVEMVNMVDAADTADMVDVLDGAGSPGEPRDMGE